ncbi:late competence development ComFB family protein [Pelorhabdus rhamnosifermentans]|uniref:late competence development ComFB family protein n=1 Tax=Pelorhabdus rhamnosifermentans TaxID=2772457 RepID=UPI001C06027C|nr:late competence development ComFB family protein [Pelorhabdus rhamnosifermentans]
MIVKNYMEDLVWQTLDEILVCYPQVCQCEHCRYDIAAIALNALPPQYVVSRKGEAFTHIQMLDSQFKTDIVAALSRGIAIVENNPNHFK